jgi:hypothetical protein
MQMWRRYFKGCQSGLTPQQYRQRDSRLALIAHHFSCMVMQASWMLATGPPRTGLKLYNGAGGRYGSTGLTFWISCWTAKPCCIGPTKEVLLNWMLEVGRQVGQSGKVMEQGTENSGGNMTYLVGRAMVLTV